MSEFDKTINVMRLLLLGQLIEKTGIPWRVSTDRYEMEVKFICRYGLGRYQLFQANVSLDKAEESLDDLMNEISWEIANTYGNIKKRGGIR